MKDKIRIRLKVMRIPSTVYCLNCFRPGLYWPYCCFRMGREMGEPWNFSQHQPLLEACLRHPSDSLRLSTLGLCVDSHSSVEAFSRPELDLIRGFLLRSLVLASPASRQEKGADCKFFFC
jgi:hypothetical protein